MSENWDGCGSVHKRWRCNSSDGSKPHCSPRLKAMSTNLCSCEFWGRRSTMILASDDPFLGTPNKPVRSASCECRITCIMPDSHS
eukprot:5531811-Amphidinium_carterae.4